MGSVYARGGMLQLGYHDASGKHIARSSGYRVGQEREATALLAELEQRAAETRGKASKPASRSGPAPTLDGVTVTQYLEKWVKARKGRIASADGEHARLLHHVIPHIGPMRMRDVKPRHVRDLMLALRTAKVRRRGTGKGEGTSTSHRARCGTHSRRCTACSSRR